MRLSIFAGAALAATLSSMTAQQAGQSRLEIRRIVLYKHGVGYFEREGAVQGDALVPLSFKTAQMKDVLKSLYAIDLNGGRISGIVYDSKDPIEKQLEDILFRVPEGSALTQFLAQLRGARVRLTVGTRAVEGSVLGIEPTQRKVGDDLVTTHKLVLMRGDGAIEPLELYDASQVEILDEAVRRDLGRMMDIYAKARYADRKTVTLRAVGEGQRTVRVGYIIETPIWKTSYRLLLDKEAAPLLQGWAIVENRTDEDWNDVRLSFVAGSPQSFVLDLYTSYYPRRPVISVGEGLAQEPETTTLEMGRPARGARMRAKAAEPAPPMAAAPGEVALDLAELLETSNEVLAQGVTVGDLFSYEASGPVSIRQGQAALVPILLERLPQSERVLYWRRDLSQHPNHALLLVNSTALTLEKGPVTVFEGSTCLGEAMLPRTMKSGMKEMLTYALETAVEVEQHGGGRAHPINQCTIANGVMTLYFDQETEMRYVLRNRSGKKHVAYLDHPRAGGDFRLVEPAKPHDEVPGHYRFKLDLPEDGSAELTVRELQRVSSQTSILDQDVDRIRFHLRQRYLSDKARALLERVAGVMEERAGIDRQTTAIQEERSRLAQDQDSIRRNMSALRDSGEEGKLRAQYVERLSRALQRSDELEGQLRELVARRQELDRQLAAEVNAFRE